MNTPLPLSSLGLNKSARVNSIQGGQGIVQRLAEMGISSGAILRVVRGKGPMIIEVKGQRLLIGHGMVKRILVSPIDETSNEMR